MIEPSGAPDDTVRERADRDRATPWLLLDADRRLVTAVILSTVFLGLVAAGSASPVPPQPSAAATPSTRCFRGCSPRPSPA
jgi:hypothetical protein